MGVQAFKALMPSVDVFRRVFDYYGRIIYCSVPDSKLCENKSFPLIMQLSHVSQYHLEGAYNVVLNSILLSLLNRGRLLRRAPRTFPKNA